MWELLHAGEAQFDIPAIVRDEGRAKEVIPNRQADTEVDAIRMPFRKIVYVMPDVHFRAVEYLFHKRAQQQAPKGGAGQYNSKLQQQAWITQQLDLEPIGSDSDANEQAHYPAGNVARNRNIGVVVMANGQGENMDDKKVIQANAQERERDIFDTPVNNGFHPVIPQVSREAHLFH